MDYKWDSMKAEVVGLSITPIERSPWVCRVDISGSGFVPNQTEYWRLRGEDPGSEDFISEPNGGGVVGTDGTFFFTDTATGANLNEDCGAKMRSLPTCTILMLVGLTTSPKRSHATSEFRLRQL